MRLSHVRQFPSVTMLGFLIMSSRELRVGMTSSGMTNTNPFVSVNIPLLLSQVCVASCQCQVDVFVGICAL
jgi:hypothetical protein